MSKIISIGTATPTFRHRQEDILHFMQNVYALNEVEKRKLKFLYHQSGIGYRYSPIADYSLPANEWTFYPEAENLEPFPDLEYRMKWYDKTATPLSLKAIDDCIDTKIDNQQVTHLITVSCTGMSAPGLDLRIMEAMKLPNTIFRTSVNFMGCYAAIHGLKLADAICKNDESANVLVVCTELCTLHFQKENTADNLASSLLFGDGSAAALITHDNNPNQGLKMNSFYSEVGFSGAEHMSWQLSSKGFLMSLSGYIPELIEQDFNGFLQNALQHAGINENEINHWCIHPGGKRILSVIEKSTNISNKDLQPSYSVLNEYGNMSSATILFVLKEIFASIKSPKPSGEKIFGAAFGPGLTMETFILSHA